ncbi:MAG: translation initiation factor IF-2 N-terminal domain-containing protein [Verrucomicrobiota bacterium]|jgi:translation initiation factor IF-2
MSENAFRKSHIPPANSMERGYLIKASNLKPHPSPQHPAPAPVPLPPIVRDLVIPKQTTVSDLASLLRQKPFQIVADLMGIGVFATVRQTVDFESIANVARKYGFNAKKAD